jgi:hypothetical protein
MAVLGATDLRGPKYFHEIARARGCKFDEIGTEPEFMKKSGSPWSIRIPAAPDSFSVSLTAYEEGCAGGAVKIETTILGNTLQQSKKDEVGRSCTIAGTRDLRANRQAARSERHRRAQQPGGPGIG